MRRVKGILVKVVAAAAVIVAVAYSLIPRAVEVEVSQVARGPMRVTVDEDGRTRIKERYVVSSPLAGRLVRVELHAGDEVEAGRTLLATVEPADPSLLDPRARAQADAKLKAAEATARRATPQLQKARRELEYAQSDLERLRTMSEGAAAARRELEQAEQREQVAREDLRSAQLDVDIASFELEQARAAMMHAGLETSLAAAAWRYEVRSPIRGRILRVFEESSTVVEAGERLMEVGNPADLEVEVDVLSQDAVQITTGAKLFLEGWGGAEPIPCRVRLVEPQAFTKVSALGVEEQRVWVVADFTGPASARPALGDGFRVEARIVLWESENVLKVPAGALVRQGEGWTVFAIDERGRAALRPLRIGHRNDLEAEVLEGLRAGDPVILYPSDRIADGVRVEAH